MICLAVYCKHQNALNASLFCICIPVQQAIFISLFIKKNHNRTL